MDLASLLTVFATAVLPTISIAGLGYLLGSVKEINVEGINTVTIYLLVPALIFHSLVTTDIGGSTIFKIILGVIVFLLATIAVAELVGRALGESGPLLSAFVLGSTFTNSGNLGIPLSEFAFGPEGRSTAVLFLTGQNVVIYTVGVLVAARGKSSPIDSVKQIFRLPLIYAVAAAAVISVLGVAPPPDHTAMRTLELVGNASIPVMLILLGIELSNTSYGAAVKRVTPAASIKLFVAPVIGLAVALLLGFENQTVARVFVLESATPAAITALMLTIELTDPVEEGLTAPEFASTLIFITTLASIPVLTLLIALLKAGVLI